MDTYYDWSTGAKFCSRVLLMRGYNIHPTVIEKMAKEYYDANRITRNMGNKVRESGIFKQNKVVRPIMSVKVPSEFTTLCAAVKRAAELYRINAKVVKEVEKEIWEADPRGDWFRKGDEGYGVFG
jgi:hypothetical protein